MIGAMDTRFLMASMGYVVGEKSPAHLKKQQNRDFRSFLFCCSGGARMQEELYH